MTGIALLMLVLVNTPQGAELHPRAIPFESMHACRAALTKVKRLPKVLLSDCVDWRDA